MSTNFREEDIPNDDRRIALSTDLRFMRGQIISLLKEYVETDDWAEFVKRHNHAVNNHCFQLEMPEIAYEIECSISIELSTSTARSDLEDALIDALESAVADVEYCDSVNAAVSITEY